MLIKRIIILFFRDKANVFMSLLAVLIIIALYILFLGDIMEDALRANLGFDSDIIGITMSSVVLAGMIAVTSITGCMGALGISIQDKETVAKDFLTSPAPRGKITMGYIFGSASIGIIMAIIALGICIAYIALNGGGIPGFATFVLLIFTVILSVLCGNSMVYFACSFIKTTNAFSSVSTVIGTLIGFLMGIYIPIGNMPTAVQWVIKCFPMSHAASMFRQLMADENLSFLFKDAPPEALEGFREVFGVVYKYGDYTSSFWFSAVVLVLTTIVFYTASLLVMRMRKAGG